MKDKYARSAVLAVELFTTGKVDTPLRAWKAAVNEVFGVWSTSKNKGCPKSVFLSLCETGKVKGIEAGEYTQAKINKEFALRALDLITKDPSLVDKRELLWEMVLEGQEKVHNFQMDVVIGLWKNNLLMA